MESQSNRISLLSGVLIFVYALGYFLFSQYPAFTNDFLVNTDTGMHSIWVEKYIGENAFVENDILVEVSQEIQPWGVFYAHRAMGMLMSPLVYTKIIPFLTFLLSCYIVFIFLNRDFGWKIAVVGLLLMSNFLIEPAIGFNARAFSYPLLFSFLYFYSGKNYWGAGVVMILASLFYPSALLISCGMVGVYHVLYLLMNRKFDLDKTQLIAMGSAAAVCAVLLLTKSHSLEANPIIGEMYSKAEMLNMEELGKEGRVKILPQLAPIHTMSWNYLKRALFPKLFLLVSLAYLGFVVVNRNKLTRLDYLLISLMIAGFVLFITARIILFKLFIPVRYLQYTYLIFWYMVLIRGLSLIKSRVDTQPIIFAGALAIGAYLSFIHFSPREANLYDYSEYAGVYEKVKTLEPNIMIAGPAMVCDEIPFFSERSVLISYETSHLIYYNKYWPEIKQRYFDFYGAYSSSNPDELQAFIEQYDIDYIIIDKNYFKGEKEQSFQPVSRFIDEKRSGKNLAEFVILNQSAHSIIPIDDRFSLLDCSKWLVSR